MQQQCTLDACLISDFERRWMWGEQGLSLLGEGLSDRTQGDNMVITVDSLIMHSNMETDFHDDIHKYIYIMDDYINSQFTHQEGLAL